MITLSTELRQRCYTGLRQCDEFDDMDSLRALFGSPELSPFRDGLQHKPSLKAQVEHVLDYLTPKRTSGRQWALVLFLDALHIRYEPGNQLHDTLAELRDAVTQELAAQEPQVFDSTLPGAYVLRPLRPAHAEARALSRRTQLERVVDQVLRDSGYQISCDPPRGAANVEPLLGASVVVVELGDLDDNLVYILGIAMVVRPPLLVIFDGDHNAIPDVLRGESCLFESQAIIDNDDLYQHLQQRIERASHASGVPVRSLVQNELPPQITDVLRNWQRSSGTSPSIADILQEQRKLGEETGRNNLALREDIERLYQVLQQRQEAPATPAASNVDTTIPLVNDLRTRLDEMMRKHNEAEQQVAETERYFRAMEHERDVMADQIRYAAAVLDGAYAPLFVPLDEDDPPLVFVPATIFVSGPPREHAEQHFVRAFFMEVYPVTNAQFRRFVQAKKYKTVRERENEENGTNKPTWNNLQLPESAIQNRDNHPVVLVTRADALAYAQWAGRRLPTHREWERAARGVSGQIWPWGENWDASRCNMGRGDSSEVDAFPNGISPAGCYDMIGNVWEWLADEPASDLGLIAGGSWGHRDAPLPPYKALPVPRGGARNDLGFRCVVDDLPLREQ